MSRLSTSAACACNKLNRAVLFYMYILSRIEHFRVQWMTESFVEFAEITRQHKMLPCLKIAHRVTQFFAIYVKIAVDLYAFLKQ